MSNGFVLRQYQKKVVRQVNAKWKAGHRSVLLVMPPNAGKTVVFLHIVKSALRQWKRVCVVAPNIVLTQQTIDKLERMNPGIIWSNRKPDFDAPLQVASAHTLANRLDLYQFDLLVIDEAHHCAADTWMKITEHYSEANVLGVTATAKRMDGKGLDGCGFTDVIHGPWIDALTPEFMSPMRLWAPNVPALLDAPDGVDYKPKDLEKHGIKMGTLIGDAVKHYTEHCKGKRALAFCMSIADSKDTVKKFKKAGYRAAHMDGNTPHVERQSMLADLNAKRLDLISSCNVLSEGLDIPGIDVVIQLRSTRSYQVYVQQVGRGLRQDESNPGKLLEVIDCAGNFYRLWHPAIDRKYGLDGVAQVEKETGERDATRKRCPSCSLVDYPGDDGKCQGCGGGYTSSNGRKARYVWRDGELVSVGRHTGMIDRLIEDVNKCGTPTYFVMRSQNLVYLGTDKPEAQRRVDLANGKFCAIGYWPEEIGDFREWLGLGPARVRGGEKRLLIQKKSNRKSDAYFVIHSLGKQRLSIHLGVDRADAQSSLDYANAHYRETGQWPDSKEEIYRLFGRTPAIKDSSHAKVYPCRDKRGTTYATKINGSQYSLGKDESVSTEKVLSAVNAWIDSGNKWPPGDSDVRALLGLSPRSDGRLNLTSNSQSGLARFYANKRYEQKQCSVSLGTDRATAQARVDAANARWEANGHKWPDTEDEFREWLGLPPKKRKD